MTNCDTGKTTVPLTAALPGAKATLIAQLAFGTRLIHVELTVKFDALLTGVPTSRTDEPVFVRVTDWTVELDPGTFAKVSARGAIASPGSAAPTPVRAALANNDPLVNSKVPVRVPAAVGKKATETTHEAP